MHVRGDNTLMPYNTIQYFKGSLKNRLLFLVSDLRNREALD
jgi:hypothetical protein